MGNSVRAGDNGTRECTRVYNLLERGVSVGQPESGDLTRLLQSSVGDKGAPGELVPFVYREPRTVAGAYVRCERPDQTLQPTALVHEAYMRLADQTQVQNLNRRQFFVIAANPMRQILVNHARYHRAARRGDGNKVALEEGAAMVQPRGVDFVALDAAPAELSQLDPRQGRSVELRFFGGLTKDEIAQMLEISAITAKRDWRMARPRLHDHRGTDVMTGEAQP